jgi:hypothetical protein
MHVLVFLVVSFLLLSHQQYISVPLLPIRSKCPTNLIIIDLMILIILSENYKLRSSYKIIIVKNIESNLKIK